MPARTNHRCGAMEPAGPGGRLVVCGVETEIGSPWCAVHAPTKVNPGPVGFVARNTSDLDAALASLGFEDDPTIDFGIGVALDAMREARDRLAQAADSLDAARDPAALRKVQAEIRRVRVEVDRAIVDLDGYNLARG